jgi:actin-related protein 6
MKESLCYAAEDF